MTVDKSFKGNSRAGTNRHKHGAYGLSGDTNGVADAVAADPDKLAATENQGNHASACQRDLFVDEDILHLFGPRHPEWSDPVARPKTPHHPGERRLVEIKTCLLRRESANHRRRRCHSHHKFAPTGERIASRTFDDYLLIPQRIATTDANSYHPVGPRNHYPTGNPDDEIRLWRVDEVVNLQDMLAGKALERTLHEGNSPSVEPVAYPPRLTEKLGQIERDAFPGTLPQCPLQGSIDRSFEHLLVGGQKSGGYRKASRNIGIYPGKMGNQFVSDAVAEKGRVGVGRVEPERASPGAEVFFYFCTRKSQEGPHEPAIPAGSHG